MAIAQIRGQFGQHGGGESAHPGMSLRRLFQYQGMTHTGMGLGQGCQLACEDHILLASGRYG